MRLIHGGSPVVHPPSARPTRSPVPEGFPYDSARWVGWVAREEAPGEKPRKVPVMARRGLPPARSTDPSTWATLEAVDAIAEADPRVAGAGLCLGGLARPGDGADLVCIDLDGLRPSPSAPWPVWVLDLAERAGTLVETSASGTGIHVWLWATDAPEELVDGRASRRRDLRAGTFRGAPAEALEGAEVFGGREGRYVALGCPMNDRPVADQRLADWLEPRPVARIMDRSEPISSPEVRDRFARIVLERCLRTIENAPHGCRNETLRDESFTAGGLVGAGLVGEAAVLESLVAAGLRAGPNERKIRDTARRALEAGAALPLEPSERPEDLARALGPGRRVVRAEGQSEDGQAEEEVLILDGRPSPEEVDYFRGELVRRGRLAPVYQRACGPSAIYQEREPKDGRKPNIIARLERCRCLEGCYRCTPWELAAYSDHWARIVEGWIAELCRPRLYRIRPEAWPSFRTRAGRDGTPWVRSDDCDGTYRVLAAAEVVCLDRKRQPKAGIEDLGPVADSRATVRRMLFSLAGRDEGSRARLVSCSQGLGLRQDDEERREPTCDLVGHSPLAPSEIREVADRLGIRALGIGDPDEDGTGVADLADGLPLYPVCVLQAVDERMVWPLFKAIHLRRTGSPGAAEEPPAHSDIARGIGTIGPSEMARPRPRPWGDRPPRPGPPPGIMRA